MPDLIAELQWRGMIQDIMPGTKEQLNKEMTTAYIGFDPTADSLHIGSLVPIILLIHLQKAGHKPIALVGGATGMVGDPSGKSEERNLLSEDILNHNIACVKTQLEHFLDFTAGKPNAAEMANNYDWFKDFSFLNFIRDVGKHITVNYMMAKDSVKKRLDGENGMSFTEFTYQLVQGYDFYWLYKNKNCKLQMGGSDQWGNIVTGTELIRRKDGGEAFAFTCPLIKKADGGKFGKTEKGNIWLDANKTSAYQFNQFWLNASDEDAKTWIKIFTFLDKEEIENLIHIHNQDPSQRVLQERLAYELTRFVHSIEDEIRANHFRKILFGDATIENLLDMSDNDYLALSKEIPTYQIEADKIENGIDLISFSTQTNIFPSKGEARKLIQNGGFGINKEKINNIELMVNRDIFLHNKYLLVNKGKKNYYLITCI
jgi:tyrosyl-tRNA synthetase